VVGTVRNRHEEWLESNIELDLSCLNVSESALYIVFHKNGGVVALLWRSRRVIPHIDATNKQTLVQPELGPLGQARTIRGFMSRMRAYSNVSVAYLIGIKGNRIKRRYVRRQECINLPSQTLCANSAIDVRRK